MTPERPSLRYRLYGLELESEIPIPGACASSETTQAQVQVRRGSPEPEGWREVVPLYSAPDLAPNGLPMVRVDRSARSGWIRWSWGEGVACWLDPDLSLLLIDWPSGESEETAVFYLVGPVMAYILRGLGVCLLHGSAVTREGTTVAFLGDSGAGKSTLAAAMLDVGFAAVTDDLVVLDDAGRDLQVRAGYAGLRLWPEAARGLGLDDSALPRLVDRSAMWPDWDKRLLPLQHRATGFSGCSHRVTHVYVLGERDGSRSRIEAVPPSVQLMDLDRCVFQRYLRDEADARRDLATLARLTGQARVRRLFAGDGLSGLEGLARRLAGELGFP